MCSVLANNQPKALRVAVETLGCRSNYADSVSLQAALLERGAVTCGFDSVADVYVLNTCTITDAADREAMKIVRQVRARAPHAKVVLTGCLAQSRRAALEGYPGIDAVVGLSSKSEILAVILGVNDAGGEPETEPIVQLASLKSPISHQIAGPSRTMGEIATRARYHLRIQDGCRNCCTYCIIPQIKNELSSRSAEDVLDDIRYLASVGYREIVLTGTHLGAYGEERGSSLMELLSLLAGKSAVRRIRISSLDPNELCPEVIDLIAENEVFCAHLHVCIQSFSDSVLKRMNRRYRMEDVREILWYINNKLPRCCIGSDVITGFPGESRQEVDKAIEEFLGLPI
ncbi:MAG TPA: MiaB/RimO family radical SAM methylthiotransferase, partial [Oligoflexia bacterium]|nr:MiaB/RimO family radical SAM methylthiotransferase [Oligoflexia bacterium]